MKEVERIRGFTIVEVVIALTLLSLIMLGGLVSALSTFGSTAPGSNVGWSKATTSCWYWPSFNMPWAPHRRAQ